MNLNEIYDYMQAQAPREGCGVIVNVNGKEQFLKCRNDAENDDEFILNRQDYLVILMNYPILAIVHSHVNQDELKFSDHDVTASTFLNIPFWLVGIPQREIIIYNG